MTREEKINLEEELNSRNIDYDYVTDFAIKNNLYYESALLVLTNKKTLAEAKLHDDEEIRKLNESYVFEENDDFNVEDALAECVKIAEVHKNN